MFDVEPDKNSGTHHTYWVNEDVFFTGKNDTGDASHNSDKLKPGGLMYIVEELRYDLVHYSASATTSLTSGIIRFIMPSMPAFRVIMEEGQPEQDPCNIRLTTPSL